MKIMSYILNNKPHSSYYSMNRMRKTTNSRLVGYMDTSYSRHRITVNCPLPTLSKVGTCSIKSIIIRQGLAVLKKYGYYRREGAFPP